MKLVRSMLFVAVFAIGAAAGVFLMPFGPKSETFVDLPPGTGTAGMASRLADAGVIRSRLAFELMREVKGGRLLAGEYRFDHPVPLAEVFRRISRGDVSTTPLTIPEGFNIFDIAQAVQTAGLADSATFLAAERRDALLIRDLRPDAPSLEGFLFPDTYRFSRHAKPDQILSAMVKRFRQQAATLNLQPGPELNHTVTLASLIEKEAAVEAERPLVAGVFTNRLSLGMPLATDPTVIYAALLEGRWRGTIFQSDLQSPSPYNTYRHPGLPPGPIANPGLSALKAAIHPAGTDFLFFVADAQGRTVFSRDLKEHDLQVAAYRRASRQAATP